MFVERSITTYENNSFETVQLMRNSPIRQNVSVRVVGGKDYDLLVRKIPKFLEHFHQFFFHYRTQSITAVCRNIRN